MFLPFPHPLTISSGCARGAMRPKRWPLFTCEPAFARMLMKREKFASRFRHVGRRLSGIGSFARNGLRTNDRLKMAIAGYARGHTFDSPGLISHFGRTFFPCIEARPTVLGGLTVALNPSDLSHLAVAEEIFVEGVYDLSVVPFVPNVVLDCGAHIGMFTLLAASKFPSARLIAFEPEPSNYEWLERNIRLNGLNAELLPAAISDQDGRATFAAGLGCGSRLVQGSGDGRHVEVQTVNLARFIRTLETNRLLLKLDVEGAEEWVLPSMLEALPKCCAIFVETHRGQDGWDHAKRCLETNGFAVSVSRDRGPYVDGIGVRSEALD